MRPYFKTALLIVVVMRLFLAGWAIIALQINPLPPIPDDVLRPYVEQPILDDGVAGLLLGPWQRFDTLHYTRIAAQGYANEKDSVFPPLFPLLIRLVGAPLGGSHSAHMVAGLLIATIATLFLLALLMKITAVELTTNSATRAAIYFILFPTAFFLFAPYSEALFILLAVGAVWWAKNGRYPLAGLLGLLAAMTRLTGVVLVVPMLVAWWINVGGLIYPAGWQRQLRAINRRQWTAVWPLLLPIVGSGLFLLYRGWLGIRPLSDIYRQYWFQTTELPGSDVWRAVQTLFFGGSSRAGEFTLWIDFIVLAFLIVTTIWVFRRLGAVWGSYNLMLLLFMLLPTSELKPLYSFSRYALAFLPTFMLLAQSGQNSWINRLILYSWLPLYLYFSGQFFIWGWVA